MDEESYEEFEDRIVQRAAERVLSLREEQFGEFVKRVAEHCIELLEERFKQRVKRYIVRKILSGGWTIVASICAWEFVKTFKLPHWVKDLIVNIVGG